MLQIRAFSLTESVVKHLPGLIAPPQSTVNVAFIGLDGNQRGLGTAACHGRQSQAAWALGSSPGWATGLVLYNPQDRENLPIRLVAYRST